MNPPSGSWRGRMPRDRRPVRTLCFVVVAALSLLACEGGSTAQPGLGRPIDKKPGQKVRADLLTPDARTFPAGSGGWTARRNAQVGWTLDQGHRHHGALIVEPTAARGLVASPTFPVVAERRYVASAWLRAESSRASAAVMLEFLNVRGQVIRRATGQRIRSDRGWVHALSVVDFAPQRARSARVAIKSLGTPQSALVDDVSAAEVSGFAAKVLPPLSTQGPVIVDRTGQRVVFRGVEIEGLQTKPQIPVATILPQITAARAWGANYVRIPVNPDYLVGPPCDRDPAYLARMAEVVNAITLHGMVAEIDLHYYSIKPCGKPHLVTMPDHRAVTFWRQVARIYRSNPLVVFNLYNEPHDVSARIWRDGGTVSDRNRTYIAVGMQKLYDTVRGTGATNLVLAAGTNFATEFPTAAPLVGTENLVYSAHAYTCPTGLPSDGQSCPQAGPGGITDPTTILGRFRAVARKKPVMINEFGFPDDKDGRFDANVISYAEKHRWAGWVAFTFDGSNVGMFNLVKNVGPVQRPEVIGMSVMTGLAKN